MSDPRAVLLRQVDGELVVTEVLLWSPWHRVGVADEVETRSCLRCKAQEWRADGDDMQPRLFPLHEPHCLLYRP